MAGLGLGSLAATAASVPGQLTSNPTGELTGVLGTTLNTANSLPVAGPLLGQVEGLTGLNGLLGQAGELTPPLSGGLGGLTGTAGGLTGNLGGLASAIPIGNLQQALLAQAVQIQRLERLVQQAGLPVNLPDTSGVLKGVAATAQDPSLTSVANAANKAINAANAATDSATGAAVSAGDQGIHAVSGAAAPAAPVQVPIAGSAVPKAQLPSFTDTFVGANQAANPLFSAASQGLLAGNGLLNGINVPTLANPPAALADLSGQLNGLAGQVPVAGQAVAQAQSAIAGVQAQLGSVASTAASAAQRVATQAIPAAQSAVGTANSLANAAQNWLPPPAQGALDPANAALAGQWQQVANQLQQLQQQQQQLGAAPLQPGKVLAAVPSTPGQDPSHLTPGSIARTATNSGPAGVPDDDVPAQPPAPEPVQDGEDALNSQNDAAFSTASAVMSSAGVTQPSSVAAPTATGDPEKEYGSMTHLVPPLTADPTKENGPTDAAFYTTALPTTTATAAAADAAGPSAAGASDAPAASSTGGAGGQLQATPAPGATQKRRRALPSAVEPQAPLPATDDADAGNAVADQAGSHLQPLAPNSAPFLQQFVDGYQAPASPADSFVSAWSSVPLPSAQIENLPTPIGLGGGPAGLAHTAASTLATEPGAAPDATFAAFIVSRNEVKAVSKSAPSPYPGWSQDTDYNNSTGEGSDGHFQGSAEPSPTKARLQDPAFQALNTPPPIPVKSKQRLRRQVLDDASKTGKDELGTASEAGKGAAGTAGDAAEGVFADVGRIKINAHNAQQPAQGPPEPPANWSQDTDYTHLGDLAAPAPAAAKAAKARPKAAELLTKRRHNDHRGDRGGRDCYRDRLYLGDGEGRGHSRDWLDWCYGSDNSVSYNSSGKGGRPPILRQKAYGTRPAYADQAVAAAAAAKEKTPAVATAAAPAGAPKAPAAAAPKAPAAAPKVSAAASVAPASPSKPAAPAKPPAPAAPKPHKARLAKVRRYGLDSVHQPPAGEHGEPAAVPGNGNSIGSSSSLSSSKAASSSDEQPAQQSSKSKSDKKKKPASGTKQDGEKKQGAGGDPKKSGGKADKNKKKEKPPTEESQAAPQSEEPAAEGGDAGADSTSLQKRQRGWTSKLSLKRWI